MNIIFDIDDTITNETEFMIKYAPRYLKKKYKIDVSVKNPNSYNLDEVFGLKDIFVNSLNEEENIEKYQKINNKFWNDNFIKYMFYPIRKDAKKIIKYFNELNYKIYFVTLRGKKTSKFETKFQKFIRKIIVPLLTKMQLKLNNIKYKQLIMAETKEEKIKIINNLKPKYAFDDTIDILENLNDNINTICIESPHNVLVNCNEKIIKLPMNFDSIINSINIKKIKVNHNLLDLRLSEKLYTENFYKLVRFFGKDIVMNTYKPIVIGQENIPIKKEASVFIGNHRNIKDPLITIALLKNPTHFAALKRMFEYNENIFGNKENKIGNLFTTLFVKSLGALPIARVNDKNHILTNLQTFKYIEDYLNYGASVAIYPEGTLNRTPNENGNILPLKSIYSFKIAENGKAIVYPVAIVWISKNVVTESKVIISFLKPIHTEGLNAKEISEKWLFVINNAINSMNKIIDEMNSINNISNLEEESIKRILKRNL